MEYNFEIVGVSNLLYFFNQQQEIIQRQPLPKLAYLGTSHCTLDGFLESLDHLMPKPDWDSQGVMQTIIQFWMQNADRVEYWKQHLQKAGQDNILVARVADLPSLKAELTRLFQV